VKRIKYRRGRMSGLTKCSYRLKQTVIRNRKTYTKMAAFSLQPFFILYEII